MHVIKPRSLPAWLAMILMAAACALTGRAQPTVAGFSTAVGLDAEGAWIYLFVDGSAGPRTILISAAGPGYATQTSLPVVSDPQIDVLNASGVQLAYNDNRADSLLTDASLPTYARTAKDAAIRLSLATGTYVVRVNGVGGATGVVGLDVVDSSARPGLASFALRARGASAVTPVRLRTSGSGNAGVAMYLSGPNLPVTNPMEDPRLVLSTFTVGGNGDGTFTVNLNDPFIVTYNEWQGDFVASRFRSPVTGNSKNAGSAPLMALASNIPITLNVQNQTAQTNGMFLLEVHNFDHAMLRAPVIYAPPQPLTVATGGSAVLRALVGGDQSTLIGFEKDGVPLSPPSASSAGQLIFAGAGIEHNGSYRVRATSTAGSALSAAAVVTVTPRAPVIAVSPVSTTVSAGSPLVLSATVTGSGLSYQWLKDNAPIPGATAATFSIPIAQVPDGGTYSLMVTNAGGSVVSSLAFVIVLPPEPGRLTNLSVRTFAGVGDRTLIVGFTLSGPNTKPVVIRGIGPALAAFGLSSYIADPRVTLFAGATEIAANNDWFGNDGRSLGAFPLPAGSRDAVVARDLTAQAFTAQVSGIDGAVGDALVEVYDGNTANSALRLVNVSTRTQLGAGERLIVGLTVAGRNSTRLLIRAVGPTLANFGLGSAHPDPRIELYSGNTVIAQNDQWQGDDGRATGAFPLLAGSKDAALMYAAPAGGYSVHVLGATSTSGIVLVEVYEIP